MSAVMMGDEDATAAPVSSAGAGSAPVLVVAAGDAVGEGSAVVRGVEKGAAEEVGDGVEGGAGDCARAGENPEVARTADAATAHSREAIFRMVNPQRTR
ncbi:hypothetical protein [Arthrobacter psychrochitiniphilus]|uniref:hypothetical protein n=1 Tax=Arthrobacter psychrochitiniphilus TaxID=291045 RepID=UPI00183F5761|nr:hypothetical protein [Arthrobacter psychrochitiniphilus]NYG16228.1 hypothetical protein [Arthrobacter psychrochitiniphilus]